MREIIDPKETSRARAFELWMKAANPMVTFLKTIDVTKLLKLNRKRHLKFNMLLCYCIGRAASQIKEFELLPVGDQLMKFDQIAVNLQVRNQKNDINSCDILYQQDLKAFNLEYLQVTSLCAEECSDRDLSEDCMVIGTSAITETELEGAIGIYSGIFNNPFMIWGRYKRKFFRYTLPISFQFHHTQMDGAHAGKFLEILQSEIDHLECKSDLEA